MHLLNHSSDQICQHGNLLNTSSELPERSMMDLKQVYWQSNLQEAGFQILWMKAQKEEFQYHKLDSNVAKQRCKNEMLLTKLPINREMKNAWPQIKSFDYLGEWCAMPTGELQSHIAWFFKRLAVFTDYVNHNQYCSHPNDVK